MRDVELIYDPDCPHVPETRSRLLQAFAAAGQAPRWCAGVPMVETLAGASAAHGRGRWRFWLLSAPGLLTATRPGGSAGAACCTPPAKTKGD